MKLEQLIGLRTLNLWVTDWKSDSGPPFDLDNPYRDGFVEIEKVGFLRFETSNPEILLQRPCGLNLHEESREIAGERIVDVLVDVMHYSDRCEDHADMVMDVPSSLMLTLPGNRTLSTNHYRVEGEVVYSGPGLIDLEDYRHRIEGTVCRIHRWVDWNTKRA
ncbi:MAG: hypothetical protein R3F19_16085 [Verrucomicrobiales bacterium]